MRFFAGLCLALLVAPVPVWAQVDLVDPDAPPKPVKKKPAPPVEDDVPAGRQTQPIDQRPGANDGPTEVEEDETETPVAVPKPVVKKPEPKKVEPAPAPVEPPKPVVPLIEVLTLTDAQLDAAWDAWRKADAADPKAEVAARAALLKLKENSGARSMEPWALGLIRAAHQHEKQGSSSTAIEMALNAVELAPQSPAVQLGLLRAYAEADPSELGRLFSTLQKAVTLLVENPRTSRSVLGDLGSLLMIAWCATAALVVLVLFLRRARYFFYDFHFFFPRGAARWQSAAVALLVLSVPVVFRLGVVPSLLALFAATTMYLALSERVVAAVLLGALGLVPTAASWLVGRTAFAGTPAESAYVLDLAGPRSEATAQLVRKRASEDKATFVELSALGSFELRRGQLDQATSHLKMALAQRADDPRVSTNLAVAMLVGGDIENPRALLEAAGRSDPTLAAPMFDLGRLYQRRMQVLGGDVAARELDAANVAFGEAVQRDPSLAAKKDVVEKPVANAFTLTAPLSRVDLLAAAQSAEAVDRVRAQLTATLLGEVSEPVGMVYPAIAALLLAALGALGSLIETARECNRCGRPVSRREDKDLMIGSLQCTQCINVYTRKGVVPPALKLRKQVEVQRYQTRMERLTFVFGALCSGMGHVFRGLPVRGAIYGFIFVFGVLGVVMRHGIVRAPYESAPDWLKLAPLALALVLVYALSLKALARKKAE